MEPGRDEQLAHLQRLAAELSSRGFTTQLLSAGRQPSVQVTNPDNGELTERVLCRPAGNGSWCFWWPWRQPIGSVEDVAAASGKIATVLRSVEGAL
jgi:hypothetical protein